MVTAIMLTIISTTRTPQMIFAFLRWFGLISMFVYNTLKVTKAW